MFGAVIHAPGDVRYQERPDPTLVEPTDAIVRTVAACVCGSDLWRYRGLAAVPQPTPIGHEYCGLVEAVGDAVITVQPSDFVVGGFLHSDNTCPVCRKGAQANCLHGGGYDGCQAEKIRVPQADGTPSPADRRLLTRARTEDRCPARRRRVVRQHRPLREEPRRPRPRHGQRRRGRQGQDARRAPRPRGAHAPTRRGQHDRHRGVIHREVVVRHELGVHALVAQDLADQAARFESSLFLRPEGRSASLRNVVDVLSLGLRHGDRVSVWADGLDESEALEATAEILRSSH